MAIYVMGLDFVVMVLDCLDRSFLQGFEVLRGVLRSIGF